MTADAPPLALIEDAYNVLCWKGYLDPDEDEADPDIVDELIALYQAGPCDVCPGWGEPGTFADMLADHWLAGKQREWERMLPEWACDCGAVYKPVTEFGGEQFYEARDDGLLGDLAGHIRRDRKGKVKHSDACKRCGASFAGTIERQADPQQPLF